jgi:hypothetical protein
MFKKVWKLSNFQEALKILVKSFQNSNKLLKFSKSSSNFKKALGLFTKSFQIYFKSFQNLPKSFKKFLNKILIKSFQIFQNTIKAQKVQLTYKIIILSRLKLKPSRLRRERPERNRHQIHVEWFITNRNNSRIRIRYSTRFVLNFRDIVNDKLFRLVLVRTRVVERANYVHLIVLKV